MDLTGQDIMKTEWELDPDTEILTVTFRNEAEDTTLGTMELEGARLRAMLAAMKEVAVFFYGDEDAREGHRTVFDNTTGKATTEFVP